LTVDAWEDVKGELFWSFNDYMLARWIPANHVVVFWALEETLWRVEWGARVSASRVWRTTNGQRRALTHIVLSGRWPEVWCPSLSCCWRSAAVTAEVVADPAAGGGAVVEAVESERQNLILAANCGSRYHPGRNGRK
jgi:hypothetical protein